MANDNLAGMMAQVERGRVVLAREREHGALPPHCAVFALTGWGSRVTDTARFLNADADGTFHPPGFSGEAAEFLRDERLPGTGEGTHRRKHGSRSGEWVVRAS